MGGITSTTLSVFNEAEKNLQLLVPVLVFTTRWQHGVADSCPVIILMPEGKQREANFMILILLILF